MLLQVATLVRADWLFLLTDVDSLYTANPATHPEAVPIPEVHDITKLQVHQLPPCISLTLKDSHTTQMRWTAKS